MEGKFHIKKRERKNALVFVCEWSRKEDGPSGISQGSEAAVVLAWSAGTFIFGGERKLVKNLDVTADHALPT